MKVFGIGLSKTGTSSLAKALSILGYHVKDCLGIENYRKGDITAINQNALAEYNALTDTPIPSYYKELDQAYPGSKFILTIRSMEGWLKSCKKQFNQKLADKQTEAHNELIYDLYGTAVFDENKFKQGYLQFIKDVKTYFQNRPDDLLIIDITSGEGWDKLCPFLGKPFPNVPFPKSNVTQIRWLNIHELSQNIRNQSYNLHQLTSPKNSALEKLKTSVFSLFQINTTDRIYKAVRRSQNNIEKALKNLDKNIPIVTSSHHDIPLDIRNQWNHFWLISCPEYLAQSEADPLTFSVNVALIEDGRPYLGIIYFPANDVVYYGALNKGSFKISGSETKKILSPIPTQENNSANINHTEIKASNNIASLICQKIEQTHSFSFSIADCMEWQLAASHALLKSLNVELVDRTNRNEPLYNNSDWRLSDILCQSKLNNG